MRWNLRLAAVNRGIWTASELQHLLAAHRLVIPAVAVACQRAPAGDVSRRSPGERIP